MSFSAYSQVLTPFDTTIAGNRYKFYVNSFSYSFNGDSTFTYKGVCEYKINKKIYFIEYSGSIEGKLIDVTVNQNQCNFTYTKQLLKAILKQRALYLIGESEQKK